MRHHAQEYIDGVVETMGNALLGRVYDLESRHHRQMESYVDKVESQADEIRALTAKVDDMVIDRDGLVEVEAGPSNVVMRASDVQEVPRYEVRGTGWNDL
jgi:hypothetical protein